MNIGILLFDPLDGVFHCHFFPLQELFFDFLYQSLFLSYLTEITIHTVNARVMGAKRWLIIVCKFDFILLRSCSWRDELRDMLNDYSLTSCIVSVILFKVVFINGSHEACQNQKAYGYTYHYPEYDIIIFQIYLIPIFNGLDDYDFDYKEHIS